MVARPGRAPDVRGGGVVDALERQGRGRQLGPRHPDACINNLTRLIDTGGGRLIVARASCRDTEDDPRVLP